MVMELTVSPQTFPLLVPPRTAPEEAFQSFSISVGQPRPAVSDALLNLTQTDPSSRRQIGLAAKAAMDEGFKALEIGDVNNAIAAFAKMAEILPHSGSYALLGYALFYGGNYLKAAHTFEKAIKLDRRDAHALALLGLTYSRLGKLPKAINAFRQALKVNPNDAGIHFYLGHLYANIRRWREAADELRAAIRLKNDFLDAYQYLADMYLDLGRIRQMERDERFQQAIDVYQELIDSITELQSADRNPTVAAAYNNIGVIYTEAENTQEALRAFEKAVEYDPDDVIGLTNLGSTYLITRRFEAARVTWNKLAEILENDKQLGRDFRAQTYYHLGAALIGLCSSQVINGGTEDPEILREAEYVYKKSIAANPQYVNSYIGLGIVYSRQGRPAEARESFVKALELNPESVEARDNLRLVPLDEVLAVAAAAVEAGKAGAAVDIDALVDRIAEIRGRVLKEQESSDLIRVFSSDELFRVLSFAVRAADEDLRFRFAAKLFERDLLSSETAALLADVNSAEFLRRVKGASAADADAREQASGDDVPHPVTAPEAERAANRYIRGHLPDRFMADDPRLDASLNVWHVPIVLSYPMIGPIGGVGEVLVRLADGEVISHTPFDEMRSQANRLYAQHRDAIEAPVL